MATSSDAPPRARRPSLLETKPWRHETTTPEAVVREAYAAYNAGELDRMVGLCSPTIEWSDPDNHLVRGQADLLWRLARRRPSNQQQMLDWLVGDHVSYIVRTTWHPTRPTEMVSSYDV
jgi:SnoaL-like domain